MGTNTTGNSLDIFNTKAQGDNELINQQGLSELDEAEPVFSIVDEVMEDIKEEGNLHLIYGSMGGYDPLTGNKSKSLDDSIMQVGVTHKEISFGEAKEGFSPEEMEILSKIVVVESNVGSLQKQVIDSLEGINEDIRRVEERKLEVGMEKRNCEIRMSKLRSDLQEKMADYDQAKLYLKELLSDNQLSPRVSSNPQKFVDNFETDGFELEGLLNKITKLDKELSSLSEQEEELQNQLAVAYKSKLKSVEDRLEDTITNLENKISKITDIEFGESIALKGGKIYAFVKCECGVCTSQDLGSMPKVILGDAFKDMEERVYKDTTVVYNKFSKISSDGIEGKSPYRLRPDPAKYRRIILPGLNNNEKPMLCEGCGKILVPPLEVIERMIHRGFLIDTYTLCLFKSDPREYDNYLDIKDLTFYPGPSVWGTVYDEFLYEPNNSDVVTDISEDFRAVDNINKVSTIENLTEEEKTLFIKFVGANPGETVDVRTIREDIISHKKSLKLTIKEILASYRQISLENLGSEPTKLAKAKERNKARKAIKGLVLSNEFVDWCVINRVTSYSLKQAIKDDIEVIKPIQASVIDYSRTKLIDSILSPTLIKNEEGEWVVEYRDIDTPHFRFLLIYKNEIEEYLKRIVHVSEESTFLIKRADKLFEASRGFKADDPDSERKVERAIRDLKHDMEFILGEKREQVLADFITKFGVQSLNYSNGNMPCWLKHEFEILGAGETFTVNDNNTYNILYLRNSEVKS